jgi:hypothetical protein
MIEEAVRRFPGPTGSAAGGPGSTATAASSGSLVAPDTTTRSSDPVSTGGAGDLNGVISSDVVVAMVMVRPKRGGVRACGGGAAGREVQG